MPSPTISPVPPRPIFLKLPGQLPLLRNRIGGATEASLWLGEEYLVQSRMMFCREHYNRFDYKDIQALLLRRTKRGLIYTLILGVFAVLFVGLGFYEDDRTTWFFVVDPLAALWILLMLYNVIRGATCRCTLQTSLGPKTLPTLSRMRPAKQALRRIAERVEAVQGALPPEATAERMNAFLSQHAQGLPPQTTPASNPRPA